MKILYLYSEIMPYNIPVFRCFVNNYNASVFVIHWDKKKLTPYIPLNSPNIFYYSRSTLTKKMMIDLVNEIQPNIIYISGWMDKDYLKVVTHIKKMKIPVVVGLDDQWHSSFRQKLASIIAPIFIKKFFDYAWVSGVYQYEFAKKIGFKKSEIVYNLYTADYYLFNSFYEKTILKKSNKYPHRFLFCGRFELIKGIEVLLHVWKNINNKRKDWELCFIGKGSYQFKKKLKENVIIKQFIPQPDLYHEIANSGCFVLPSFNEPWGLVIHEFALSGLPILTSKTCGAATEFVIDGFNGFTFSPNNIAALENAMLKIIDMKDEELIIMSKNSNRIAQRITPEISAASFLSILNK